MAHYDVVPATDDGWEHPPFAADLDGDGEEAGDLGTRTPSTTRARWWRSSKPSIPSCAQGTCRCNDVYLSFGHDEETVGKGAQAIVAAPAPSAACGPRSSSTRAARSWRASSPAVSDPIAMVGVSEKGITTLRLRVAQAGGHASTPPRMTATVRLARAITRLNARPFPARLSETNLQMIETLGAPRDRPAPRMSSPGHAC